MKRFIVMVCLAAALAARGCPDRRRPAAVLSGGPTPADSVAADSTARARAAAALPMPELGYNAREGRALYRHYCINCHGDEGKGDGFNAFNLDPRPRALADSTFQAGHSDDDLAAVIRSGGGAAGLSTGMPPWGRTLNERKIQNIIAYLRTWRAGNTPARGQPETR